MDEGHHAYLLNLGGVVPYRIRTYVRTVCRFDGGGVEGHHFALLTEEVVAVHILQGIGAIVSVLYALDGELSASVGACHADEGLAAEEGVMEGRVGSIESDEYALYGFQILGIEYRAGNLHCVDGFACTERVCVFAQGITLIIVNDGVAKVDGIGGVGLQ